MNQTRRCTNARPTHQHATWQPPRHTAASLAKAAALLVILSASIAAVAYLAILIGIAVIT